MDCFHLYMEGVHCTLKWCLFYIFLDKGGVGILVFVFQQFKNVVGKLYSLN